MMPCRRYGPFPTSRRDLLFQAASGFGGLALSALWAGRAPAHPPRRLPDRTPASPPHTPHFPPRATAVIFLFMDGGPSQVDTFDPKPRLDREHGMPIQAKVQPTQFNNVGTVLKSPWKFRQHGQSGIPVSDLFPHVAQRVDDLAIIRSMTSSFSEHTAANYFFHTGSGLQGRPSQGAWITYGLGSESRNLPGFVVLNCGLIPPGGVDCFTSGFLPATFQGSLFKARGEPIPFSQPAPGQYHAQDLTRRLDQLALERLGPADALESAIANDALAARMQTAVPELTAIDRESPATRSLYSLDDPFEPAAHYGRACLLARRLVERGVRFVEVLCPAVGGDRWDQHANLREGHQNNARATDRAVAALLTDLKSRGLLDSTLVLWGGEFGRTPMAQGADGRDHNPFGFSVWLAGGGIKGGTILGATDDYGYHAVEHPATVHDLHATILHLLGINHKQLTYRFGGRDMRLTDVHGELLSPILA